MIRGGSWLPSCQGKSQGFNRLENGSRTHTSTGQAGESSAFGGIQPGKGDQRARGPGGWPSQVWPQPNSVSKGRQSAPRSKIPLALTLRHGLKFLQQHRPAFESHSALVFHNTNSRGAGGGLGAHSSLLQPTGGHLPSTGLASPALAPGRPRSSWLSRPG